MTTGSWSVGTDGGPGSFALKQWSGPNGKYETVNGKKRMKWNNYQLDYSVKGFAKPRNYDNTLLLGFVSPGSFSTFYKAKDDLVLQSKLVTAVRGHNFNLAVNVAQGKEACNMVVANLKSIGNAFVSLKHGNFASAARALGAKPRPSKLSTKDLAGRWLELQYGWLPLLGDTYEAMVAYSKLTENRKSAVKVNRTVKFHSKSIGSTVNNTQTTDGYCRKSIIYEMSENISTSRSLGLKDPLSVIWEIIPYSFVVDWFLPIGSYLDNLSIIPNLKGRFCTSQSMLYGGTSIGLRTGSAGYVGARTDYSRMTVTRIVSTGLSVVGPSFVSLPSAMSPKRIWNAIALTRQKMNIRV